MRWDITKKENYLRILKRKNGRYDFNDISIVCKEYKYVYGLTIPFRSKVFNDGCILHIFTDVYIKEEIFDYFNNTKLFRYTYSLNILTLYDIKDKIEIL